MDTHKVGTALLILVLTLLSGFGDAQGFLHSARVWAQGKPVWEEVMKATLGYILGILMYWLAIPSCTQGKPVLESVWDYLAGNANPGVVCRDHHRRGPVQRRVLPLAGR